MKHPNPFHFRVQVSTIAAGIAVLLMLFFGMEYASGKGSVPAADVEILTPLPGSTINARNPETHLVLRQPEEAEEIRVKVEASGKTLKPVESMGYDGQIYRHFRLPLSRGMNGFILLPAGRRIELAFKRVHARVDPRSFGKKDYLFHREGKLPEDCGTCHELVETERIEPVGIEKQVACASCHKNITEKGPWRHSTTVNQQCLACHEQSNYPLRIGFPLDEMAETCFTCHTGKKAWHSKGYPHGPLHVGGCMLCHDPHGEENRYQLWAEGSLMLCLACHSDKRDLVQESGGIPYVHGILLGEGCIACHDPHAADYEFMLREPINDLCVGCHPALAGVTRGHPVTRHPVSGPTEFLRRGRKLTCTSCHDPHGAWHKKLLIETIQGARLCHACHDK